MDGPEHYRAAEERMRASDWQRQEGSLKTAMHEAAMAQVHATLALAATTALLSPVAASGYDDADLDAWREAAGHSTTPAGQPEPPRLTARDLITRTDIQYVACPEWNEGQPVRIDQASWAGEQYDEVSVRYQDAHGHRPALQVLVAADHPITLAGGAE